MSPITGAFNDAFISEMYERFRQSPESVDESWRQFFTFAQSLAGSVSGIADESLLRKVAAAAALVEDIRHYGHLAVRLDPLGSAPVGAQGCRVHREQRLEWCNSLSRLERGVDGDRDIHSAAIRTIVRPVTSPFR